MSEKIPAQKLYECLLSRGIVGSCGKVFFEIHNEKYQINDNSIVGNVIQAWLKSFMENNGISYRIADNSQDFPDFFLHNDRNDIDLLEVKCFTKSANFDIANFLAYCNSILNYPYRLNTDYLIIKYTQTEVGINIDNIWLKKVWEICRPSERSAINLQIKHGQIYNIRPGNWYGKGRIKYPPFTSRMEFIKAIQKVLNTHPSSDILRKNFTNRIAELFKKQTNQDL